MKITQTKQHQETSNGWTQVGDGVDDGTFHIPLGHSFPYYDGVFTNAWMSSNGFIILYDATAGVGNANTSQSWCRTCGWGYGGGNPSGKSNLSYMVAPLWTDLDDRTTGSDRDTSIKQTRAEPLSCGGTSLNTALTTRTHFN